MRWLSRFILLTLIAAGIGTLWFLRSDTFSKHAVALVEQTLAKNEIHVTLGRLYFHPIQGLMAEDIKLYEDETKSSLVIRVGDANLRMKYTEVLKGRWELEGIRLEKAQIQLPANPEQGALEITEIADLSADIRVTESEVEVKRLRGMLFGLRIQVEASLARSPKRSTHKKEDPQQQEARRKAQWELWRSQRQLITQIARAFDEFESPRPPLLEVSVVGDAAKLETLKVKAKLRASDLNHAVYQCQTLEADATFENQYLEIHKLFIQDRLGQLQASAAWRMGEEQWKFSIDSQADILGFLAAFSQKPLFREFVVYEPLSLQVQGSISMPSSQKESGRLPLTAIGSFGFGKVLCRGEMFEGFSGQFSASPEGVYVTNAKLKHHSGGIEGQVLWNEQHGIKYHALFTMDLRAFLPFISNASARTLMQYFERHEDSRVHVTLDGESPDAKVANLVTRGHVEMERVTYRGVYVPKIQGDIEIRSTHQVFSNLKVEGPDGTKGTAKAVTHYPKTKSAFIDTADANVNVADLVSCFAPGVANEIRKYKFSVSPRARAHGTVSATPPLNDLKVNFSSSGVGYYELLGETYEIDDPVGRLDFKGSTLNFDIKGKTFGQPMHCDGEVLIAPKQGKRFRADFTAGLFPYEVFGKMLPFRKVNAVVKHEQGITRLDIKATAFEGQVEMKGSVDERKSNLPYDGEIEIRGVVFKEFAKVYSPVNDTEGDLTGHFKYRGLLGDWMTLQGDGAVSLLNGNLYAVPILGPLTPLLGSILPKPFGQYNVAKEADCTFNVRGGHVYTDNVEAMTGVFRLVAKGSVDFINDRVKMEAQARFRGIPGIVFTPISELLEYVCEGSVSDPQWRPKYFSTNKPRERMIERAEQLKQKVEKEAMEEAPKKEKRTRWFLRKKD